MPIIFVCAKCGRKLKAPDKLAGKKTRCPKCGEITTVIEAASLHLPVPITPRPIVPKATESVQPIIPVIIVPHPTLPAASQPQVPPPAIHPSCSAPAPSLPVDQVAIKHQIHSPFLTAFQAGCGWFLAQLAVKTASVIIVLVICSGILAFVFSGFKSGKPGPEILANEKKPEPIKPSEQKIQEKPEPMPKSDTLTVVKPAPPPVNPLSPVILPPATPRPVPELTPEQKAAQAAAAAAAQAAKDEADAARKLRLAKPFIESNQKDIARRRLEEIVREYPRTKAAAEAKELLEKLR